MNKLALKHFIKLNALELPTSFHNVLNLVLLTFHYFTINNIKIGNKVQNISTFPNIYYVIAKFSNNSTFLEREKPKRHMKLPRQALPFK